MMATRSLTLRTGDARDVGVMDALMAAAFDSRWGEAWTRSQAMGVLAMPGIHLVFALVDDIPAGFALTRAVLDEAELLLLAVTPAHRRTGVGTALMQGVLTDCAARGVTHLHLEVRENNPAIAFYQRHGFTRQGIRRGYYRGHDGVAYDAHTYARVVG